MKNLNKNNSGFTLVEVLLVVLTLAIIGVAGYSVAKRVETKNTAVSSNFSTNGVTIDYVNMPGLNEYNAGKIGQLSYAREAQGNYIYVDMAEVCSGHTACSFSGPGKIVYDNKTIFNGTINNLSLALSSNGLKYTYNQINSNGDDIVAGVTDSGTVAYYDNCSIHLGHVLVYSNSSCVANSYNLSYVKFSSNLQSYIAGLESNTETPSEGTTTSVIYNGKTINTDAFSADLDDNISENGQHYIYSSGANVVVDGKTVTTTSQSGPSQWVASDTVTDQGRFAFTDCNGTSGSVNVNGAIYQSVSCGTTNPPIVALDDDNNNYFYFTGNESNDDGILNGKTVQLSGKIDNVQFDDNTLYVYRWVN